MKSFNLITIILLFVFFDILSAEYIPQKSFANFTVQNGIPYASIEEFHFDRYQNLWFLGSNNQIYYFDGRNYFHFPLTFLDSVNVLNSMTIKDDTILITTQKKIFLVDDIYSSQPREMQLSFLPAGEYTKIVHKNNWFYTVNIDSGFVVYFNLSGLVKEIKLYEPLRYLLLNDSMLIVSTDRRKILVFKERNGDYRQINTINLELLEKDYYIEPLLVSNNTLYALVNEYGIISVEQYWSHDYKIKSYKDEFPGDINPHYILLKDKFDGTFWTGGFYEGLYHWIPGKYVENVTELNGLSNNLVRFVVQDDLDRIWFGTQNGISVLKNKYVTIFNKNSGLKNGFIWGISKIGNKVYFCTNAGLYTLEKRKNKFVIKEVKLFKSYAKMSLNYIGETSQGIYFTTSQKYGLYKLEGRKIKSLRHLLEKSDCRLALYIYEDSRNRIWIGGYDIGYLQKNKYVYLETLPFSSDLKNRNIVYDIVESPVTGHIYFATTNGLYAYNGKEVIRYQAPYQYESIYAQIEFDDKTNKILIGSDGKGLIEFDENSHTFQFSPYNRYVKGENVYNIKKMDSLLLITTNVGLTAIPESGGECLYVNSKNGLLSNETNTFALDYDDQYLYLGTTDGLHILLKDLKKYSYPREGKLYIKEITSDGEKIRINGTNDIKLPSDAKHLKVRVGYTSYFDYEIPKLKYSFVPYFNESKISDSWEIEFYNLPFGRNALTIQAVTPSGEPLSENSITLNIYHAYPYYYSWKFYLGLVLGLIILIYIIIKIRTYRLEKISRRLRKEVEKQYQEIAYLNKLLEKIIQKSIFGLLLFDAGGNCIKSNQTADEFITLLTGNNSDMNKNQFLHHLQMKIGKKIEGDGVEIYLKLGENQTWQITKTYIRHGDMDYDLFLIGNISDAIEKETYKKQMQAYQQIIATVSHYINNTLSALHLKNEIVTNKNPGHPGIEEISKFVQYTTKKITYILQTLDSSIKSESIKTSDYANIKDLLIDIEKYVADFEEKNKWK